MQFEYENEKVEKILCDTKTLQRKVGLEVGKKIKQRMNQLQAANNFNEYLTKLRFRKSTSVRGKFS